MIWGVPRHESKPRGCCGSRRWEPQAGTCQFQEAHLPATGTVPLLVTDLFILLVWQSVTWFSVVFSHSQLSSWSVCIRAAAFTKDAWVRSSLILSYDMKETSLFQWKSFRRCLFHSHSWNPIKQPKRKIKYLFNYWGKETAKRLQTTNHSMDPPSPV